MDRGTAYAAAGRVKKMKVGEDAVSATVRGTRSYKVRLWVEAGGPSFSCTCPVGEEGLFCKHCVAVGLVLTQEGGGPAVAGSGEWAMDLRSHLEGQDKGRLVELLLAQAEDDEFFRGRLLLEAAKAQGVPVDLAGYRRAIEDVINVGDYVDYRAMYAYSRGIEEVIDSVEALLEAGHATEVVELCEQALGCLEDALGYVDDSDGYLGGIRDRVCDLHHAACAVAGPNPEALAARLFEWELHSEWETFLGAAATYADVLGEAGLAEYRRRAEEVWSRVPPIGSGEEREHSTFRFHITLMMETLARMSGDLDALVAINAHDLSSAYSFVEICELYREVGRYDDALAWAERGVAAYPERTDIRLREILADEYHRRGRHDEAMALMWAAYSERPTLDSYQRLKKHGVRAREWKAWRAKALDLMRSEADRTARRGPVSRWGPPADRSELVKVFLWEGDVEAAWEEAVEGACSVSLWMTLAARREADHPEDALPLYQEHVERVIGEKNNRAYEEAVELLRKVRELMGRLGRGDEFPAYVASTRAAHKPKRNLMKLLDQAGW